MQHRSMHATTALRRARRVRATAILAAISSGVWFGSAAAQADERGAGGPVGGEAIGPPAHPCVPATTRAQVNAAIDAYRATHDGVWPTPDGPAALGAPPKFTFYPMAGRLYQELYTHNFVDLDAGPGVLDWFCGDHTYNGHNGNDTEIRTFGEQVIGVPVYAALDGVVIIAVDGEPDMNTSCNGAGNYVIIDHGFGRVGWYFHLAQNSVAVGPGDPVEAGQIIGMTASSGCSTYPHLHFEVRDFDVVTEPYTGPCHPGESQWVDQTPIDFETYIIDAGVTHEDLWQADWLPYVLPSTNQLELTDPFVSIWYRMHNLPANSIQQWEFVRPDGTISWTSPNYAYDNPEDYRTSWWWATFDIFEMHRITGEWTIRLRINGDLEAEIPILVVETRDPDLNRAPAPVTLSFAPAVPTPDDVLFGLVDNDLILDDVDFDIVRYRWVWTVNDVVVRDAVTAARSDALPRSSFGAGDVVGLTVTPGDGVLDGPPASGAVIIDGVTPGDLNGDGFVDAVDLAALLAGWGQPGAADLNGSGAVDAGDLAILLANWT